MSGGRIPKVVLGVVAATYLVWRYNEHTGESTAGVFPEPALQLAPCTGWLSAMSTKTSSS